MANIDGPYGFRPVGMLNGGKIPMRKYRTGTTTAIWKGDIVIMTGADNYLLRSAATTPSVDTVGVAANYLAAGASVSRDIWVYDDPNTIFEIQSDGTTDTDSTDYIGSVATLITANGNTTTGIAKLEIDASAITSSGTATNNVVKIISTGKGRRNDASSSHADLEVLLMNHMWGSRLLTASI